MPHTDCAGDRAPKISMLCVSPVITSDAVSQLGIRRQRTSTATAQVSRNSIGTTASISGVDISLTRRELAYMEEFTLVQRASTFTPKEPMTAIATTLTRPRT